MNILLSSQKNFQRCHLYLDMKIFSLSEDLGDLNITQEQRTFAEVDMFADKYPNTTTSLYHTFGCIRIDTEICKTAAKINLKKIPFRGYHVDQEDAVNAKPMPIDLRHYIPVKPKGVLTSMSTINAQETERISVVFNHEKGTCVLRYSYADSAMADLFRRIQKLHEHKREFTLSNYRLRRWMKID